MVVAICIACVAIAAGVTKLKVSVYENMANKESDSKTMNVVNTQRVATHNA